MKAEPFTSFDNFFSGMAGSVSDITEKKTIQMELSERDKRAKETLEKQVQERTAELQK